MTGFLQCHQPEWDLLGDHTLLLSPDDDGMDNALSAGFRGAWGTNERGPIRNSAIGTRWESHVDAYGDHGSYSFLLRWRK
ncbi:hypothetical protein CYMTET_30959 [Cymbomonas tetramitiformis]|uniref:Uncharacterized protein n=1 Tax=Cymbomonas tetramitiformis TaxID=36881 RepID=A0AAE0FI70_9CHLO|nr:hypothetical protein CYMTET_30959 [Cymbomonas tetramitiformis]